MKSVILLGGNLEGSKNSIESCLNELPKMIAGKLLFKSKIIETKALEDTKQDDFLNAVCVVETPLDPFDLLKALQELEKNQGRVKDIKRPKGPRLIDLDILYYQDFIIHTHELILPHPQVNTRPFVMELLNQIPKDIWEPVC